MMQEIENYPTALINLNSKIILVPTYLDNFVFLNLFPKTKYIHTTLIRCFVEFDLAKIFIVYNTFAKYFSDTATCQAEH